MPTESDEGEVELGPVTKSFSSYYTTTQCKEGFIDIREYNNNYF